MKKLTVEKGLLEEFKFLLEIPETRQYLYHAKEVCNIYFSQYIKQSSEAGEKGEENTGKNSDEIDPGRFSIDNVTGFRFHLECKQREWQPSIEPGDSGFEIQDLLPEELIEFITAHSYAQYQWYIIKNKKFPTKNYGWREFYVGFKYMREDFITGEVKIFLDRNLKVLSSREDSREVKEDNIIHMNRNRRQFFDMLSDQEAWEFLHYFFTFPFLRAAVLAEFRNKIKPFLTDKFDDCINRMD